MMERSFKFKRGPGELVALKVLEINVNSEKSLIS
jgi:hypothetical protein